MTGTPPAASTAPPRLDTLVAVRRRFQRAVHLERDAGVGAALDGYLVTPAVRRAIDRITRGLTAATGGGGHEHGV